MRKMFMKSVISQVSLLTLAIALSTKADEVVQANGSPPQHCRGVVLPAVFARREAGAGSGLLPYPIRLQESMPADSWGHKPW